MKYTVITSFHEEGLKQYGQRMVSTFEQHWPKDVDLVICAENCQPHAVRTNTQVYDLLALSANCRGFVERHKNNPLAHGLAGPPEVWNPKKAFRWNAVRFAYKVFSVALCADTSLAQRVQHGRNNRHTVLGTLQRKIGHRFDH